ncbi:MAG: cadherin-like beta sandwich domain-containing protein, partial [Tumebacillaceae bacterium]
MSFDRFFRTFHRSLCTVLVMLLVLFSGGFGSFVDRAFAASTWTTRTSSATFDLMGVEYGGGLWVAAGWSSGEVVKSTDGVTWSTQTLPSCAPVAVKYAGSQWVAVCDQGKIVTSPNGTTWTARTSGVSTDLLAVTYNGSQIVVTGKSGVILTSADGVTWAKSTAGVNALNNVTYGGGLHVAVGDNGVVYTSADGVSWTTRTSGTTQILYGVTYGNGLYVAVGIGGTLLTSPDGVSWTKRTVPSGATDLYGVAYSGAKFVAVGDAGTILSSTDGITWGTESSGTSKYFNYVAYGGSKFVAVGQTGLIDTQDAPLSTNANLSALTLSQGTLSPAFSSGTTSYTASVANGVTSVQVTPTVADTTATMKVNGVAATSGNPVTVPLNVGSNTITIALTAQDGITQKTYTVAVTRAQSSNANLSGLTLSQGTLSPAFEAGTTSYTANVANGVTSVQVTPTVADSTATLKVNGATATSGSAVNVPLNIGANTISVLVTAQDGTQKTYTITVTRAASANADLSNLTLSQGTLSPAFASGTTSYSANVANEVTNVDVTAMLADSTASVKVNGVAATSGSAVNVPLNVGANTISVLVTAQDGTTQKTYTITVTRAEPPLSSNANLSNLALSNGTLDPTFASDTHSYTASVANGVSSVDVTATVADGTATMKVNGVATTSGTAANVALNVGANTIDVTVTAQD